MVIYCKDYMAYETVKDIAQAIWEDHSDAIEAYADEFGILKSDLLKSIAIYQMVTKKDWEF